MEEETIDLEHDCELVVEGDYKRGLNYSREILEIVSTGHDPVRIYIRKKK